MSTPTSTYALRLPKSVKAEAEAMSKADGTSLNQFVAIAVAERIVALKTAAAFETRRQRATGQALDALLARKGGEPPRAGDELPEDCAPAAGQAEPMPKRAVASAKAAPPTTTRRAPKRTSQAKQ